MNSNIQTRRAHSEVCARSPMTCSCPRPQINTQQQSNIHNNSLLPVQVQNPNIATEGTQENDDIIEDVPLTPEEIELMCNIQYRTIEWVNSVRKNGYKRQDTESLEYEEAMYHYDRTGRPATPRKNDTQNQGNNIGRNDRKARATTRSMIKSGKKGAESGNSTSDKTNGSFQIPKPVKAAQNGTSKTEGDGSGSVSADDKKSSDSAGINLLDRKKVTTATKNGVTNKKLIVDNSKQSTEKDNNTLGGGEMSSANKALAIVKNKHPESKGHKKQNDTAPATNGNGMQCPSFEGVLTRKRLRDQKEQATAQPVKKKIRPDNKQNEEGRRMRLRSGDQIEDVVSASEEPSVSGIQTRSKKNSLTSSLGKKKCD